MFKKSLGLICVLVALLPLNLQAASLSSNYPRLANYFLKWEISDDEVSELAKWNLLILDMENQTSSRKQILKIRELNPQIIILAYISSQEILDKVNFYNSAYLRQELNSGLDNSWWLRDVNGNKVQNWPGTFMLNLSDGAGLNSSGQRFSDYLPDFVNNHLKSSGLWDGVFYDNIWSHISWSGSKPLDINNDGVAEGINEVNKLWEQGLRKMLTKTRALTGNNFIITGNSQIYDAYQPLLNGMMFEDFPAPWENNGSWSASMKAYLKFPQLNLTPQLPIINVGDKNQNNFRHLRFGFGSTLLGDGFYSYDYGTTNHGQTWWYDEYNVDLGAAKSDSYNLLDSNTDPGISTGLWRRDFKNGITIVNSSDKKKTFVFQKEQFEKIKGSQDKLFNNGQRINYIQLEPRDAVVLLKTSTVIKDGAFTNGYFFRVFNWQGNRSSNGFFSYLSMFPGESEVFDGQAGISMSANKGQLNIFKNGRKYLAIKPYGVSYQKNLNLSIALNNNALDKIIVGSGIGGGPQVQVFSPSGKLESSFFAYDKNIRGGVSVAVGDINGDGLLDIVTGAGKGDIPIIKIFSLSGKLESSFFAYDKNMRGGVSVAVGDVNGDGQLEVVTTPASAGGPQVRTFSGEGKNLSNFFAFDQAYHGGIKVVANDVNGDGISEILVGLKNFY